MERLEQDLRHACLGDQDPTLVELLGFHRDLEPSGGDDDDGHKGGNSRALIDGEAHVGLLVAYVDVAKVG